MAKVQKFYAVSLPVTFVFEVEATSKEEAIEIADDRGSLHADYDCYGNYKARIIPAWKVRAKVT
jgi:hypothetical protein